MLPLAADASFRANSSSAASRLRLLFARILSSCQQERVVRQQQTDLARSPKLARRICNSFIALFLLLQLAIPIRYYFSANRADERFSWRMFSSYSRRQKEDLGQTRVIVRETVVRDGQTSQRAVDLPSILSKRWIRFMQRERSDVIAAFLHWRISQSDAERVTCEIWRPSSPEAQDRLQWTIDKEACRVRLAEARR